MKWRMLELVPEQVARFAERFQVSSLTSEIFLRRGVTAPEELRFYLENNVRSAHNPFLFNDMENVVERIGQAVADGEKVMVCGDRDVDGMTAAALMVRKFKSLGIEVSWRLPMENSPYGLSRERIGEAQAAGVTLIVTVDCGITNLDEIDHACELGIDVIVIDHHNPSDELPAAVGIINPKVEDSGYPFAGLCAAALAAKVSLALDFARTPLYGGEQCLINVRPGIESLVFEAVKLRNLVEVARLSETIVGANPQVLYNRVVPFIQGSPLFIYDAKTQMPLLKQLFGETTDIFVTDLAEETWRTFPELKQRSLLRMIPGSRLARFAQARPEEIDALKNLTLAVFQARIKEVYQAHEADLALVALSSVADMMPMQNENRILVRKGLESLQNIKKGGLHALLVDLGLVQPPLALRDIGWRICPVLNSSGRMGRPDVALRLLLTDDPSEALKLVKELQVMNEERKKHGDQAWVRVLPEARRSLELHQGRFIMVRDDEIPRGITGILAGRLARDFQVPAVVLAQVDGNLIGSMRSARGLNVTGFLAQFGDLLVDWGGHDAAGGFYLSQDHFDEFSARLTGAVDALSLDEAVEAQYMIDITVPPKDMSPDLWKLEETFSPFGQDSPPLLYRTNRAVIRAMSPMGKEGKHLRLTLSTGTHQWPAVFWDAIERVPRDFTLGDTVDILFRLEKNTYNQNTSLQLNLVDICRSPAGAGTSS
jgi:single-stranded-DNA-specific exonuclease